MGDGVTDDFRNAVSQFTDVPVEFLKGDTAAAVWDSAQAAIDWKDAAPPPQPATAAVNPSMPSQPIPMQQLVPGDDWLSAWRAGRLTPMGAPQPPPRRNNGHSQSNEP